MTQKLDPKHLDPSFSRQLLVTAKEDLNSAKMSTNKRQRNAIFDLQQAVEKTTKAFYVLTGTTNDNLLEVRHTTPKVFFNLFQEHESSILAFCLQYRKAFKYWKKPAELKGILSLKKEMAELKKDEIQGLFAIIDHGYEKTRQKIDKMGIIGAKHALTQLSKDGLGKRFLTPQMINEFASDKNLQFVLVDLFIALLYLYVLGLITYPHAESRYPDTQLIDYRSDFGLSECFDLVADKTEFAINSLETFWQKIISIKLKLATASTQNPTMI